MKSRVTKNLASRSLAGLSNSIGSKPAMGRALSKFARQVSEEANKRKRLILLNLNNDEEAAFWQLLHNKPETFKVITEKESHQRGEYVVRIVFYEIGDNLPEVKTKEELFEQYGRSDDFIE